MRLRRVAVIGGGPGGLYAARLLRLSDPHCQVDVYEKGSPEATFGFGVGLAAGTQRNLRAVDADSLEDILRHGYRHDMMLQVGDQVARMTNDNLRAIGRSTLLGVLQKHAEAAGARLHFGSRIGVDDLDADLIIAADGVASDTRDAQQARFGLTVDTGDGLYLWCGTDFALDSAVFAPVETEHGTFVTHAYPYAADRSTFLIETDERTWRRAGLDAATEATAFDESDHHSLEYLRQVFVDVLQGHPLIGNRTRWLRFRTVRCAHWHVGNVVLLGDAAHTAHYSIGSGTKLAMEDAIALVDELQSASNLHQGLQQYESQRRPAVEHLQAVATRSQRWWDSFPGRTRLPINQLLVSYMTRAGKVTLPHFAQTTPAVVAGALVEYAPAATNSPTPLEIVDWTIAQPLTSTGVTATRRDVSGSGGDGPGVAVVVENVENVEFLESDPWSVKADALMSAIADRVMESGVRVLRVVGPTDRDAVLDRLDFAERLRMELGVTVIVRAPAQYLADLAAGLVAGRTDLLELDDGRSPVAEPSTTGVALAGGGR